MPKKVISFPHLGSYHVPIETLIKLLLKDCKILPTPVTARTLELGGKYSPDFVCSPFKYTLGNYIEALEGGANVLIQGGGGCRYGFYAEVQEQILRDMGYEFEFISLLSGDMNLFSFYRTIRRLGSCVSFQAFLYYLILIGRMVFLIDNAESYIRGYIGFQTKKNSFEQVHAEFLSELRNVTDHKSLSRAYARCVNGLYGLEVNKPGDCLKVGLVGELYTLMEPYSNFFMEKTLAKSNIEISRFTNATYLLFTKKLTAKNTLRNAGGYLKYHIGADGTASVAKTRMLAEKGYDGIIHVKPFGCTPEVNAMPMLQHIGTDYKIPVLYMSFDSQTSEEGVATRLEAFSDMISMRRQASMAPNDTQFMRIARQSRFIHPTQLEK